MSKEDCYSPRGDGERRYRGDGEVIPIGGLQVDNETARAARINSAGAVHTLLTYTAADGLQTQWSPDDERFLDRRYARDANDCLEYMGCSFTHNPGDALAVWFIWKYTRDANSFLTRREGPLVGAWNDRAALGWT